MVASSSSKSDENETSIVALLERVSARRIQALFFPTSMVRHRAGVARATSHQCRQTSMNFVHKPFLGENLK